MDAYAKSIKLGILSTPFDVFDFLISFLFTLGAFNGLYYDDMHLGGYLISAFLFTCTLCLDLADRFHCHGLYSMNGLNFFHVTYWLLVST